MCKLCDPACLTCNGGTLESCLSCKDTFLYNNTCNTNCPDKFYKDVPTKKCLNCLSSCNICENAVSCKSCPLAAFLSGDPLLCLGACPDRTYGDLDSRKCVPCSNCKTCFGSTSLQCLSCDSGTYLTNFSCKTICPTGTYADATTNTCVACHQNCGTCINGSQGCITCSADRFYLNANPADTCLRTCPSLFYNDSTTRTCKDCAQNCKTCSGGDAT